MKKTYLVVILLSLISCATVDLPPGGDKDITPPKVVFSNPDSAQLNVSVNQIRLVFDEYFTTKNLNSQLLISPPFETNVKSKIKGKNLLIDLPGELKPNTTYQFYFGNTIADLNEGNETRDLRLVFSTGNHIDSSSLSGKVLNAFTQEPEKETKVFLYKTMDDSLLVKQAPYYVTLTDKSGHFHFENISPTSYVIFALADKNNNNRLDQGEAVAFLHDTVSIDQQGILLHLAESEEIEQTEIKTTKEIARGVFQLVFTSPLSNKPLRVTTTADISNFSKTNEVPYQFGLTRDTLYLYYPPGSLSNDTIKNTVLQDTTILAFDLITGSTKPRPIKLSTASLFKPIEPIQIKSNYPVLKTHTPSIRLMNTTDSTYPTIDSILINSGNTLNLFFSKQQGKNYTLYLDSSCLTFIDQRTNQADTLFFKTASEEQTGNLEISISIDSSLQQKGQFWLLLQKQGESKETALVNFSQDTVITFNFLEPSKYEAHVYQDINGDLKWTKGNYFEKRQNEPIWRINSPMEVRPNWTAKDILLKIK
ncbi:MAG: Ig-like domain-containing protein [Bacteroidia bacterium]|nr:Ig-like domain-containing protein [Bacteroidia bacterium]